jgi:hypothetical protein
MSPTHDSDVTPFLFFPPPFPLFSVQLISYCFAVLLTANLCSSGCCDSSSVVPSFTSHLPLLTRSIFSPFHQSARLRRNDVFLPTVSRTLPDKPPLPHVFLFLKLLFMSPPQTPPFVLKFLCFMRHRYMIPHLQSVFNLALSKDGQRFHYRQHPQK